MPWLTAVQCAVPILDLNFCLNLGLLGKSEVPNFKNKNLGQHSAPSDLKHHYGNGVFDNVYPLALDNTKRLTLPVPRLP